jgi:hypothetical protein
MIHRLESAALALGLMALATPLAAQPLPAQQFPYKSGPVTITSCTVNENTSNSTVSPNSLRINYYNNVDGSQLTSITFRVVYAQTPITITDTGAYEFKAPITHQFNQLGGTPWAGPQASICRVLTATFADGHTVNPEYDGPDRVAPAVVPAPLPPPQPAPNPQ